MKKLVCGFAAGAVFVFCAVSVSGEETSYVKSTDTYKRIRAAIEKMKVVDTHEHLDNEPGYLKHGTGFF